MHTPLGIFRVIGAADYRACQSGAAPSGSQDAKRQLLKFFPEKTGAARVRFVLRIPASGNFSFCSRKSRKSSAPKFSFVVIWVVID